MLYNDPCPQMRLAVKAGTFGAIVEYGVEERVSSQSSLSATMVVGFPTGVTVRLKLTRASQTYLFPFHLSDEILVQVPAPLFHQVTPLPSRYSTELSVLCCSGSPSRSWWWSPTRAGPGSRPGPDRRRATGRGWWWPGGRRRPAWPCWRSGWRGEERGGGGTVSVTGWWPRRPGHKVSSW